jgi:hypothetical protein
MAAIMALSLRSFQERATHSLKPRDRFVCALCEIVVRAVIDREIAVARIASA